MRRWLPLLLLSACAPQPYPTVAVKDWTPAEQRQILDEEQKLPADSILIPVLTDYARLRRGGAVEPAFRIESLCARPYGGRTAHRASHYQKGHVMTSTPKSTENHSNDTTVHSPKAPGQVEKVNPTTGDTTTESTHVEKPAGR